MKRLLTLKHWQLFLLLFALPFTCQLLMGGFLFMARDISRVLAVFPVIMLLYVGLFFSWFYALGTNLHKRLPATVPMSLTKFKLFLFMPAIYMILLMAGMELMFAGNKVNIQPNPLIFLFIVPMHLFSMFCIIYCLYFNAKALKAAELQRPVTFNDFIGEFFLLWFFPVGIWILQPRINKIAASENALNSNLIADSF